jgi:hypothetical protein
MATIKPLTGKDQTAFKGAMVSVSMLGRRAGQKKKRKKKEKKKKEKENLLFWWSRLYFDRNCMRATRIRRR